MIKKLIFIEIQKVSIKFSAINSFQNHNRGYNPLRSTFFLLLTKQICKFVDFTLYFFWLFLRFIEYQNMLLGRSKSRRPQLRLDDLIEHLKNGHQVQAYILLQSIASQPQIIEYFKDLHLYTTCENFRTLHKYQTLNDGLYILLKGQIAYLSQDKYKKRQNTNSTKTPCVKDQIIILNQPLTIFDSLAKNCTAQQQSYLLKMTPEQEISTQFSKGRQRRRQLYENHYLSLDHYQLYKLPSIQRPLNAEVNLHSVFRFQNYTFRQIIKLNSPAIISEGRAKLKVPGFNSHQFDQSGLLLPNLKYEVTSSSITIMIIRNHASLSFNFNLSLLTTNDMPNNRRSKQHRQSASLTLFKHSSWAEQSSKRKKQLAKVTKQIQTYSIFPSFLGTKKFKSSQKIQCIPPKPLRRRVNFINTINYCNSRDEIANCASQPSIRYLHASQSTSLHKVISSNKSIKCTQYMGKNNASPSEGHLLVKLKKRLQQNEKYKSIFTEIVRKHSNQDYKECFSSQ